LGIRKIKLTKGKHVLVDETDYEELSKRKWYCSYSKYATRNSYNKEGKKFSSYMHREILGLKYGDKRQVDHINHNTLDNRRENLRLCSNQQNQFNRKVKKGCTSKYKGVGWRKDKNKWTAQITVGGKNRNLGYFNDEKLAANTYACAAILNYGPFFNI